MSDSSSTSSAGLHAVLSLARGEFVLDVELHCPPGVTSVMGPSGSGKSTLLALLAGLAQPDRGSIELAGTVWLDRAKGIDVPTHRRQLAYVFQNLALFPHMNAIHNVTYGMPRTSPRPERIARAEQLLAKLGVAHLAHRRPRTYSGGEAQRVALARAIARSPQLVLLDEPFSALDRDLKHQLIDVVRGVVGELGVPMVHVTHSVAEARLLADRVVRIERGKLVASGTPDEVLANITSLDD